MSASRKVVVAVRLQLLLRVDEGASIADILNDAELVLASDEAEIEDTQELSYEVLDSR